MSFAFCDDLEADGVAINADAIAAVLAQSGLRRIDCPLPKGAFVGRLYDRNGKIVGETISTPFTLSGTFLFDWLLRKRHEQIDKEVAGA